MAGGGGKYSPKGEQQDGVTTAIWRSNLGIDPVVGWLVCHEGLNQGRDYRICSGRNVIGRDPSSQICLRGDESVSRENHAKIFYDPKDASFYVTEGEGRSGVYVNGKVVLQATLLNAYDVLEIGRTKLVFVPLCGPKFRWKERAPAKDEARGPARAELNDNEGDDGDTVADWGRK